MVGWNIHLKIEIYHKILLLNKLVKILIWIYQGVADARMSHWQYLTCFISEQLLQLTSFWVEYSSSEFTIQNIRFKNVITQMIFPTSKNKNDFGLSIFVFVYTDELSVSHQGFL